MTAAHLQVLARVRDARSVWVDLDAGRRVRMLRPMELEAARTMVVHGADISKVGLRADLEEVVRFATHWEGFSEASFLGGAVGSTDALPFHADLWREWVSDHLDDMKAVSAKLIELVVEHQKAVAQLEKNSQPS